MALDGANYISELQTASPANTDPRSEGASQIRTVKRALQQSFPNVAGVVDASHVRMNDVFQNYNLQPGMIMMWSGLVENVPAGWAICDGEIVNGQQTPNLMGKFIKGATYNTDGTPIEDIGDTGGQNTDTLAKYIEGGEHALTIAEMPPHSHTLDYNPEGSGGGGSGPDVLGGTGMVTNSVGEGLPHSHSFQDAEGQEFNNQPEYFVLAYIMFVGGANLTA